MNDVDTNRLFMVSQDFVVCLSHGGGDESLGITALASGIGFILMNHIMGGIENIGAVAQA